MAENQNSNRKNENVRRANRIIQTRSFVLMILMGVVMFVLLFFRLFDLQITRHEELQGKAVNQQTRRTVVTANRGTIYDAGGNILAISSSAETIILSPLEIDNAVNDTENPVSWTKESLAAGLAEILGKDASAIRKRMDNVKSQYEVIQLRADEDTAAKVRSYVDENKIAGVHLVADTKRYYPYGSLAAQVIGYMGAIPSADKWSELQKKGYKYSDTIGVDGIEASMEDWLTQNSDLRQGYRVVERDRVGKITRELSYTEPQDGNNVKLTIIASYQQAAERAIEDNVRTVRADQESKMAEANWLETNKEKLSERDWDKYPLQLADTGVFLVLDVDNGNVLAMAQYPTYDLNVLIAGGEEAAAILTDERNVMMNYAIQQRAEPGSTFKMVTALAALVNKKITPMTTISDKGPYTEYTKNVNEAPTCWANKTVRNKDHQNLDIIKGLSKSCNYFFYELGHRLYGDSGSTLLYQYSVDIGLTSKTGIDLPGEKRGIVGNQTMLYDSTVSLDEQRTWQPMLVAAKVKQHLQNVGAKYGVSYDETRLNKCVKRLMDMAVSTGQDKWVSSIQPILMEELNMTRDIVILSATVSDIFIYLNDIKWGGSMEIQTAIGQGITMVTPIAMSRYIAALANGGIVWNVNIIDSIISPEGEVISKRKASRFNTLEGAAEYLPYIKAGMAGVVDDSGTADKQFKNWKYREDIWAKTGTSQVTIGKIKLDLENNAWFCALTPYEQAEIAIVCFIPNGYAGGRAATAVKEFITWWMDEQTKDTGEMAVVPGNELMP